MAKRSNPHGNPYMVSMPGCPGWNTFVCSRFDQLSPLDRGMGARIRNSWSSGQSGWGAWVEGQFNEPVELYDAGVILKLAADWTHEDDAFEVRTRLPATSTTPNAGSGNVNLVPIGGGANLIVPAVGGSHDVTLADAVPVKAVNVDGYWDVDYGAGTVTAGTAGASAYNLFDFEITSYYSRDTILDESGHFNILEVSDIGYMHPSWYLGFRAYKGDAAPANGSSATLWVRMFREHTTAS